MCADLLALTLDEQEFEFLTPRKAARRFVRGRRILFHRGSRSGNVAIAW
jgi:hypothetical protein